MALSKAWRGECHVESLEQISVRSSLEAGHVRSAVPCRPQARASRMCWALRWPCSVSIGSEAWALGCLRYVVRRRAKPMIKSGSDQPRGQPGRSHRRSLFRWTPRMRYLQNLGRKLRSQVHTTPDPKSGSDRPCGPPGRRSRHQALMPPTWCSRRSSRSRGGRSPAA